MQLITFASAAAAIISTASADVSRNAVDLQKSCDTSKPLARVINRCDYPVYLWSVFKGNGCPSDAMVTLKKGEVYQENYIKASEGGETGVSIKISRTKQCKGNDITQLEYFLEDRSSVDQKFHFNYLDVSYVDCVKDCPSKQEGFYLKAGTQSGEFASSAQNTWCPILSCSDPAACAKMAYILPDDTQTKTCALSQNMEFYMCGSQAPSSGDVNTAPPKEPEVPKQPATNAPPKAVSTPANYKVNAAAVTPAPEIKEQKPPKIKTNVVYVTKYEYVNAKRHDHAHAHARRHQNFHA